MEPKSPSLFSEESATGRYSEPSESNSKPYKLFI
jgi:hypothetical protein